MKAIADTLHVARSNLIERERKAPFESNKPRGSYAKPEDMAVLPIIRQLGRA